MSFLFQLYRVIVPKPIRTKLLLSSLAKKIPAYHEQDNGYAEDPERIAVMDFIKRKGVQIFPYDFTNNYNASSINVFEDPSCGLKYVMMEGKRLYFKRRWSEKRIRKSFHDLSLEQDKESPHRYLSADFNLGPADVLADFGAAEGNFSLSVIEKIKKVYLFESDPEWMEALEMTFLPWKDKIEIVPRFVSDRDDEKHCSGDVFFSGKQLSFLKIDVDGGERKLLKGFANTIRKASYMKIALCTYHQHDDEVEFTAMLQSEGYAVAPSKGYMIFYYDKKLKAPYIRRALVRAIKNG
jgi:hypothetical protein